VAVVTRTAPTVITDEDERRPVFAMQFPFVVVLLRVASVGFDDNTGGTVFTVAFTVAVIGEIGVAAWTGRDLGRATFAVEHPDFKVVVFVIADRSLAGFAASNRLRSGGGAGPAFALGALNWVQASSDAKSGGEKVADP
jgi:hypothetical protein